MERSEVRERIYFIVGSITGYSVEELSDGLTFEALGIYSLELVQIETALENEFGIELGNSPIEPTATLADLIDLIILHMPVERPPTELRTFSF